MAVTYRDLGDYKNALEVNEKAYALRCRILGEEHPDTLGSLNNLAAAFTMLSQGVPFLQAGEEMLRTKPGKKGGFDENSYRSSDKVNALKWATLDQPEYRPMWTTTGD